MSENQDKITIKRLISNVFYVLKYAFGHDRTMALSYITGRCIFLGTGTFMDTFLLMRIINILTTTADIVSVIKVLAIMLGLQIIRLAIYRPCENFFWTRMVGFSGAIQRELMSKAQMMDLKYYDIPEYYNDFIMAASQSEEMTKKAVMCVANIASNITAMLVAGTMIIAVDPVVMIFPIVGFIINIITRFNTILKNSVSAERRTTPSVYSISPNMPRR